MDKWTFAEVIAVMLMVCLLAIRVDTKHHSPEKQDRANFKAGEIIPPDYAHDDTLVVIDAPGLNAAIEQCDGSDGDIWGALHRHCAIIGQTMPDYGIVADKDGYWVMDYIIKDSIRGTWGKTDFDSLMFKWNY